MLAVSQLNDDLQNFAFDPIGRSMCLFGDPVYLLRVHLQASFRVGILTRDMEMLNESMSAVRSSVLWLFGDIVNYFKFLDFFFKKIEDWNHSSRKMYIVCSILRSALTCLYSNTTADFLD